MFKLVAMAVALCLMFGSAGCSWLDNVDKDKVLDAYTDVIQSAGKVALTNDFLLKGDRKFGVDSYVGTYTADYNNFTGTEYLFGNTSIERESGKSVTINCEFDITDGTAKLFWLRGSADPIMILEGTGKYNEIIELPEGGNYFGVTGDNLNGSIKLKIIDAKN